MKSLLPGIFFFLFSIAFVFSSGVPYIELRYNKEIYNTSWDFFIEQVNGPVHTVTIDEHKPEHVIHEWHVNEYNSIHRLEYDRNSKLLHYIQTDTQGNTASEYSYVYIADTAIITTCKDGFGSDIREAEVRIQEDDFRISVVWDEEDETGIIYQFDKDWSVILYIEMVQWDIPVRFTYMYDDDHRLRRIEKTLYLPEGERTTVYSSFFYDGIRRGFETGYYLFSPLTVDNFRYTGHREIVVFSDDVPKYILRRYPPLGTISPPYERDSGLEEVLTIEFICDSAGNEVEQWVHQFDASTRWFWAEYSEFDKYGNWQKKTVSWPNNNNVYSVSKRSLTYYAD